MVGLSDGISLLMLIPFLHLIGFNQETSTSNTITSWTEDSFAALNLPLNLASILLLYTLLISSRSLLLYYREIVVSEVRLGFVDHLRIKLYQAIGNANWLYLSKKRTSDLTHVLTSDINRVAQGTYAILQILVSSSIAIVYIIVALKLSIQMTLLALGVGCILLLILWPQVKKAKQLGNSLGQANRQVFGTTSDFLEGIKLAKSYTAEERYLQSFRDATHALRAQQMGFTRSNATAQMYYQIGAAIALSVLFYTAAVVLVVPSAELLVLVFTFSRLLPLLSQLQRHYQRVVHMLPAYHSAMKIQHSCEAAAENLSNTQQWQPNLKQHLKLQNISFRYDKKAINNTLHKLSLTLVARQTMGIIGESGAGKSTLADIYAGLIYPDEGSIFIDQHRLTTDDLYTWRQSVAYVPQETFLFHDSIRNNLLWANPNASDTELMEALTLAAAKNFVEQLPQGIDTVVGDRGIRLSGGERQRIALARALLSNPLLLILDEATSALDTENEKRIQQAIDNLHGEMTIIIIAHRLSTLEHADTVIDLGRPL